MEPYLQLEEIKLVAVDLPPTLVAAINEKQKQEQLTLEYKYRLQREEKEAERVRTEAAGIRDFNLITSKASSEVFLRWRGIGASLDLAKSNNSKVIVLGGGQSGSPVMLNVTDVLPASTPTPSSAPAEPERVAPARKAAKK